LSATIVLTIAVPPSSEIPTPSLHDALPIFRLDDPVAKYVVELQQGGDIHKVTLGQLATHTSGLLLPQDHPPWPDWGYTLPEFIRDRKSTRLNSSHGSISYAVFCLKKKKKKQ